MKAFYCRCGTRVFFRNTHCLQCNAALGFDPLIRDMRALDPVDGDFHELRVADGSAGPFQYCAHYYSYNACNWLVPLGAEQPFCLSCELNQTVPDLSRPANVTLWIKLEAAKRQMIYSLLMLDLPIKAPPEWPLTLAFAFLEDARSNPEVRESFIATGHARGLITINIAEADDAYREQVREQLGEHYRTILGHFRHEIGHYYYELLVANTQWLGSFTELFGDPTLDYDQALERYYQQGSSFNWSERYISPYAEAHPLEDWAETWAHYLHIIDTLDTAMAVGFLPALDLRAKTMDTLLAFWLELSVGFNALNRSMGLNDAYPFVITDGVVSTKLNFVHRLITAAS